MICVDEHYSIQKYLTKKPVFTLQQLSTAALPAAAVVPLSIRSYINSCEECSKLYLSHTYTRLCIKCIVCKMCGMDSKIARKRILLDDRDGHIIETPVSRCTNCMYRFERPLPPSRQRGGYRGARAARAKAHRSIHGEAEYYKKKHHLVAGTFCTHCNEIKPFLYPVKVLKKHMNSVQKTHMCENCIFLLKCDECDTSYTDTFDIDSNYIRSLDFICVITKRKKLTEAWLCLDCYRDKNYEIRTVIEK